MSVLHEDHKIITVAQVLLDLEGVFHISIELIEINIGKNLTGDVADCYSIPNFNSSLSLCDPLLNFPDNCVSLHPVTRVCADPLYADVEYFSECFGSPNRKISLHHHARSSSDDCDTENLVHAQWLQAVLSLLGTTTRRTQMSCRKSSQGTRRGVCAQSDL